MQQKNKKSVRCPGCTNQGSRDFCWACSKQWKSGGGSYQICGYSECYEQNSAANLNSVLLLFFLCVCFFFANKKRKKKQYTHTKILANCPTKLQIGFQMPTVRACPNCNCLIEHVEACKHMKCQLCKNEFCFLCLKLKIDGKWQCGSSGHPCGLAPRQRLTQEK